MVKQWGFRLTAVALAVSVGLLVALGVRPFSRGWRGERRRPPPPYGIAFIDEAGRPLGPARGPLQLVLDPWTFYRNRPCQETPTFSIDERGFRRSGLPAPSSPRPLIAILGGSLVFGLDLARDDETLSARLSARLPEYEFLNAGVVGFLSGQELALMVHHVDRLRPAGYLVVDGWNDVFDPLLRPRRQSQLGMNGEYLSFADRLAEAAAAIPWRPNQRPSLEVPKESPGEELEAMVSSYVANVERMAAFARARGAWFAVAFQPEIARKLKLTEGEARSAELWERQYGYRARGIGGKYARFVDEASRRCRQLGIDVIDLTQINDICHCPQALFVDPVHLNARGHEVLADHLAERMRRLGPLTAR